MKESNIILTPIPQANGEIKNRPTLILREMPKYQDFLVCGISTQLKQYIPNFDEIISPNDDDFQSSGLVSQSVIRLSFLAVIARNNIIGSIGIISTERHNKLLHNLSKYLVQ
ncbi:type II toxin-antitoxin system PemK/MazF family toxin [Fortiea sp. LEGE XX443]|uniref:type II toxin-antitoxin system PemK/MazF family toxin n=1 Tax=Fortiea sp. LEGE XX443 TaxID=1828611 RepID=UPI00187E2959|nr:type II toxin-antitoxin system PemK/MazF family toxin [Fortiea sp. LEGE XX443]MBE9004240.1 type II toxin-antitoxin system PemK/MazF family toxin [Fortiea sp. LEGE XX443]